MISKSQIKFIRSLHLKKERELHRRFIAEGSKGVMEAVAGPYEVTGIYALPEWVEEHAPFLSSRGLKAEAVTNPEMERITALATPSPALAVLKMAPDEALPPVNDHSLKLILDEIQDPGNLGTIIRIADWFGIRRIICSAGTVEFYNPKVIQATMGSFCRVKIHYLSLPEFLASLPATRKVYGTFIEGNSLFDQELTQDAFIVIGNESRGVSSEVGKFVTDKISIPSYSPHENREEHAESLNAAVATAIVCAEFRRRAGK